MTKPNKEGDKNEIRKEIGEAIVESGGEYYQFMKEYFADLDDELTKIGEGKGRKHELPESDTLGRLRTTRLNWLAEKVLWETLGNYRVKDPIFIQQWKKAYREEVDGMLENKGIDKESRDGIWHEFKQGNDFFWEQLGIPE